MNATEKSSKSGQPNIIFIMADAFLRALRASVVHFILPDVTFSEISLILIYEGERSGQICQEGTVWR